MQRWRQSDAALREDHLEPPEAGRGQKTFLPRDFRGNTTLPMP